MSEAIGGEASRHRPLLELAAGLVALPPAPREVGRVVQIVRRPAENAREVLDRARLTPEEGMPGDGWSERSKRNPDKQLAVIDHAVAELVANGQPVALSGDNLFVELDLSKENLPPGSRLRVGQALVEASPEPHDGCHKFRTRFGADALRFVQARETRHRNLRGVYWRVLEAGEVRTGSAIHVLCRGASSHSG